MARIEYEVDVTLAHPAPARPARPAWPARGPVHGLHRSLPGLKVSHAQETQEKRKKKEPTLRRAAGITLQYGARRKAGSLVQLVSSSVNSLPAQEQKRKGKKETERIRDEKRGSVFPLICFFAGLSLAALADTDGSLPQPAYRLAAGFCLASFSSHPLALSHGVPLANELAASMGIPPNHAEGCKKESSRARGNQQKRREADS